MVLNWQVMRLQRFEAQLADRVVPASNKVMSELRDLYRIPAGKMTVIGGGCNPPLELRSRASAREALGLPRNGILVAFVGRRDPIKGFDIVATCVRRLRHEISDLHLVTAPAQAAQPDDGIWGVDLTRPQMGDLYSAADMLVSASRYEGYGLAIHEAMAHGIPVIIPDSAGIADRFADGINALILPRWRGFETRLLDSMRRLATDEQLRHRLGEAGRTWAAKNTWREVATELSIVYAEAARR
jgi:glycosyltransferase involved in cell wall biosynthesis